MDSPILQMRKQRLREVKQLAPQVTRQISGRTRTETPVDLTSKPPQKELSQSSPRVQASVLPSSAHKGGSGDIMLPEGRAWVEFLFPGLVRAAVNSIQQTGATHLLCARARPVVTTQRCMFSELTMRLTGPGARGC